MSELNREEWKKGMAIEQEYIGELKKYWDAFNKAVLDIDSSFRYERRCGPYCEERYRFAFSEFSDAESLKDLLAEQGIEAIIKEPSRNTKIPKGYKCFEVTLPDFISMEDYKRRVYNEN
jgi:hypothetical protein